MHRYHDLSEKEKRILIERGTEPPHTGKYHALQGKGVFLCKQCDAPLYFGEDQFLSGCGWPSFDSEVEGAIQKTIDPDQVREEIRCKRCQAHLGHVFFKEGFTSKNVRHCVNSAALEFVPCFTEDQKEKALFAGGCFWGVEYFLQKMKGVISTEVGFMGGDVVFPTYEEVCREKTGHREVVQVLFDPKMISYEELTKTFFEIHDPTQESGQGPDLGEQYESAVFYLSLEQKEVILKLIDELKRKGFDVVTKVLPASRFYPAEEEHQKYYERLSKQPYCHRRVRRF